MLVKCRLLLSFSFPLSCGTPLPNSCCCCLAPSSLVVGFFLLFFFHFSSPPTSGLLDCYSATATFFHNCFFFCICLTIICYLYLLWFSTKFNWVKVEKDVRSKLCRDQVSLHQLVTSTTGWFWLGKIPKKRKILLSSSPFFFRLFLFFFFFIAQTYCSAHSNTRGEK